MKQSKDQSNVVNLNDKRKTPINESAVAIQNLNQVLQVIVREHGAKITLDAVQGMIQDIAKDVRAERSAKPSRKAVSNG